MSVEKSLDLIRGGVRRFQLDGFWLRDDEFYINRKRAYEICLGMINEKLDVGFYTSGTRVQRLPQGHREQLPRSNRPARIRSSSAPSPALSESSI